MVRWGDASTEVGTIERVKVGSRRRRVLAAAGIALVATVAPMGMGWTADRVAAATSAGTTAAAQPDLPHNPAHPKDQAIPGGPFATQQPKRPFLAHASVAPHTATPVATFTVSSTVDAPQGTPGSGTCASTASGNPCTLRAAIMEANAEGVYTGITLPAGHYTLTIAPSGATTTPDDASTGDLNITDAAGVVITGAGAATTTVDATGLGDRVLSVNRSSPSSAGGVAQISGATFTGGNAAFASSGAGTNGGDIAVADTASSLTLNGVTVSGGHAASGGGLFNLGTLEVDNSTVTGNAATSSGGGIGDGGGDALLQNDTVSNNMVVGGSATSPHGGGIDNSGAGGGFGGGLSIVGGTVGGNTVTVATNQTGSGAGIYISEGTQIVGTTISGNTVAPANAATNVTARGGGVYNNYGLISMDQVTVSNNATTSNNTGSTSAGPGGGGFEDAAGATVTNSTITGNAATGGRASGGGVFAFSVSNGSNQHGTNLINDTIAFNSAGRDGGGVEDFGSLVLQQSSVHDNSAVQFGGGVDNEGLGELITDSVVQHNSAGTSGGGIYFNDVGVIERTTISGNTATVAGGGIWSDDGNRVLDSTLNANGANQGAGAFNAYTLEFVNDTIASNGTTGASDQGGAIYERAGANSLTYLINSTVDGNTSSDGGAFWNAGNGFQLVNTIVGSNSTPNCSAAGHPLTSLGYNLDAGNTCGLNGAGDIVNTNPQLGPLGPNGGPTLTEAPVTGSPVIDAGGSLHCPSTDQRGVSRPQGPACDIGSVEVVPTKASPTTATTPASASISIGAGNTDSATVTGNASGGSPTGSVSFFVCGPLTSASGCTSGGVSVGSGPVTLTPGTSNTASATSASFVPSATGTWCFRGVYSGDVTYAGSGDGSATECFTVTTLTATMATTPVSSSIALGSDNRDIATVSGSPAGGAPTGSVSFFVCGPLTSASGCTSGGTAVGSGPVTLTPGTNNASTATSAAFTPTAPGTWCFRGAYSGDGHYSASSDGSGTECFTVSKGSTMTATTPASASISLGAGNSDSATVTGNPTGGTPTGSVTFFVCGPLTGASGCASGGTAVGSGSVTLTPGANNTSTAASATFTPTAAGTWCFRGAYSGDGHYPASSDGSAAECFAVSKASTTTATTPASASISLGAGNTDNATVSGMPTGGAPTGGVTFFVCGPLSSASGCASGGTAVGSGSVTLTPGANNTSTATSAAFTPNAPGTWCFRGVYSGDSNYTASTDATSQECFTVTNTGTSPPPAPSQQQGYWLVASDGGIFPFGSAVGFGSTGGIKLNKPIVGMAATPDRGGYWLVASDGGIFPFGDAGGFGSTGNVRLNRPIVGMASTPDGGGYWLVASDGGIFPFGDAGGFGSTGNVRLNRPIVGMASTPDGGGYWLVASDGGIFPFGDAGGFGSTGNLTLNRPIVGMAAVPGGGGYWLVASDGGIFPFGPNAGGFGSTGSVRLNQPIVAMAATSDGMGYWLVASDGGIFPFGDAAGLGSLGAVRLNQPVVGMATA